MGLDQNLYVFKSKKTMDEINKEIDKLYNEEDCDSKVDKYYDEILLNEIGSWRKHANLQGYCSKKWHLTHDEDFNTVYLELTKEDCEEILELSKNNSLPYATGFFWGKSTEEDNAYTIEVMQQALHYIKLGYRIAYYSWW